MDTYHSRFFAVSANIRDDIDIRTTFGSRFVANGDVRTTNIPTIGGADVPNQMDTYLWLVWNMPNNWWCGRPEQDGHVLLAPFHAKVHTEELLVDDHTTVMVRNIPYKSRCATNSSCNLAWFAMPTRMDTYHLRFLPETTAYPNTPSQSPHRRVTRPSRNQAGRGHERQNSYLHRNTSAERNSLNARQLLPTSLMAAGTDDW
ncbi:uncharacterized protein IWZ02DRAFT_437350 [Phyllosticta citriasiana]|uniref:uncharacterized protein n=1 Tax=Phyllosticta citriasiana TaxID=595635 RepID=UPI0030FDC80F